MNNLYNSKSKIIYRIILISIALLVIIAMSVAIYYENETQTDLVMPKTRIQAEYEYLLKSIDGQVAVFKRGEEEPIEILSVYTNSLPTADKMELMKGIMVFDDIALKKIIEDFES